MPEYKISVNFRTDGTEKNGKEPVQRVRTAVGAIPGVTRVRIARVDTDK